MIRRGALFAGWAFVGMVFSYAALYAFTPFGLAIIGGCIWVGLALRSAGGASSLESIGLLAGPGLFCLLVARSADDGAAGWATAGGLFVAAAVVAYALIGRARCARSA